jgi:hypothetical protein
VFAGKKNEEENGVKDSSYLSLFSNYLSLHFNSILSNFVLKCE